MAIRDRFRRALHKSDDSSAASLAESNTAATITTNTSSESGSEPSSLRKSPTGQSKFSFWSKSDKEKEDKKAKKEKKKKSSSSGRKVVHPRDKPLTASNLRHQEMLSEFTWTFGSSPDRLSQIVDPSHSVSPCCTRPPSINGDTDYFDDDSIAPDSPRGEESSSVPQ